jgi:tRNA-Thr(GGU) m(6)t(6)A37 methyltransferase TsaA
MFQVDPIGYFHSSHSEKYSVPRQSNQVENDGVILLNSKCQFEQALEGLEQFDRIWVVFRFHLNKHWKPKALPPRSEKKRGVFATRSPYRPNFIGLSSVELVSVKGLKLQVKNHDLIDGTPILDIKPYLNYADSFISNCQGWLDELPDEKKYTFSWSDPALTQASYLFGAGIDLKNIVEMRLRTTPFPSPNNRIKNRGEGLYELAYKSWRITYHVGETELSILRVSSGYDAATLAGEQQSRWQDVPLHLAFNAKFTCSLGFINYKGLT